VPHGAPFFGLAKLLPSINPARRSRLADVPGAYFVASIRACVIQPSIRQGQKLDAGTGSMLNAGLHSNGPQPTEYYLLRGIRPLFRGVAGEGTLCDAPRTPRLSSLRGRRTLILAGATMWALEESGLAHPRHSELSAPGHVWTTPALQEESDVRLAVGYKSCVRPVCAAP
jgi:hypothetical protein